MSDTPRTDEFAKEMNRKHDPLEAYKSAGVAEINDWEEYAKKLEGEVRGFCKLLEEEYPVLAVVKLQKLLAARPEVGTLDTNLEVVGIFKQKPDGWWIELSDREGSEDPEACFLYRERHQPQGER